MFSVVTLKLLRRSLEPRRDVTAVYNRLLKNVFLKSVFEDAAAVIPINVRLIRQGQ